MKKNLHQPKESNSIKLFVITSAEKNTINKFSPLISKIFSIDHFPLRDKAEVWTNIEKIFPKKDQ